MIANAERIHSFSEELLLCFQLDDLLLCRLSRFPEPALGIPALGEIILVHKFLERCNGFILIAGITVSLPEDEK
jgi:hypothetical protein